MYMTLKAAVVGQPRCMPGAAWVPTRTAGRTLTTVETHGNGEVRSIAIDRHGNAFISVGNTLHANPDSDGTEARS